MKDHIYLSLPPFPPSPILLAMLFINLIFSLLAPGEILFQIFAYLFGLSLLNQDPSRTQSKIVLFLNLSVMFLYLSDMHLNKKQQLFVFIIVCMVYSQYLFNGIHQTVLSLTVDPVYFEIIFFTIQLGVIIDFFIFFTGFKMLKIIPLLLRIAFNFKVGTTLSYLGIMRFSLKCYLAFLVPFSVQWIALQTMLAIWETGVDYFKQFKMNRVILKTGTTFYPKFVILFLFIIDSILQWNWYFGGEHKSTLKIAKRIIWNFVKLQSRASENPIRVIICNIINKTLDIKEVSQICM